MRDWLGKVGQETGLREGRPPGLGRDRIFPGQEAARLGLAADREFIWTELRVHGVLSSGQGCSGSGSGSGSDSGSSSGSGWGSGSRSPVLP